jgi:aldose 1-epimerase
MSRRIMKTARRSFLTIAGAAVLRGRLLGTKTGMVKQPFGAILDGTPVSIYTLTNGKGLEARVMNYGAILVSLKVPGRDGQSADVTLGYDSLDGYLKKSPYFGAVVGRYANRIGGARFKLNGTEYKLAANNGPNCLHGGLRGFDKRAWKEVAATSESLELLYESPDGEEGFPGTLATRVTYTITPANELRLDYHATAAHDTVLNLTNHSYFNLAGEGSGEILDHRIQIMADRFTPTDAGQIPTGELSPVAGTPLDFRTPQIIGARIDATDQNIRYGKGYDHNYVVNGTAGTVRTCARVEDSRSGRVMEVLTSQPGVQFYTGNNLDGTIHGKGGKVYAKRSALCLETQHFPDSPNQPRFPSTELKGGQTFVSTTIYRFSIQR